MANPQPAPAKDWCFTINNPKAKHWDKLWALDYQYLVFQVEVGAEGTPHIQGFVQLRDKVRLTGLKKLLPKAHLEKRKGTPEEAAHYCKKPVPNCSCIHCCPGGLALERFDDYHEAGSMSVDPIQG